MYRTYYAVYSSLDKSNLKARSTPPVLISSLNAVNAVNAVNTLNSSSKGLRSTRGKVPSVRNRS